MEVVSLGKCPKDQQSSCSARGSVAFLGLVSAQPVFPLPSKCSSRSHGDYAKSGFFSVLLAFKACGRLEDLKEARFRLGFWCLPSQTMAIAPACLWLHTEMGCAEGLPVLLSYNSVSCVVHFCFFLHVHSGSWLCARAQPALDASLSCCRCRWRAGALTSSGTTPALPSGPRCAAPSPCRRWPSCWSRSTGSRRNTTPSKRDTSPSSMCAPLCSTRL